MMSTVFYASIFMPRPERIVRLSLILSCLQNKVQYGLKFEWSYSNVNVVSKFI